MKKLVAAISKMEIDMDCWIDYYHTLGFDIIIYDDNDIPTIKSDKIIKIYRNIFDNIADKQIKFYDFIIKNYQDYDWIALLDCDEYLVHDINSNLDDILFEYKNFTSVCPNWVFFGSNGHSHVPNGRVFENFLLRQKNPNRCVKSIVQPKLVSDIFSAHYICGTKPSVSANMDIMPDHNLDRYAANFCSIPSDNKIWINHYFCKSKEHWANKVLRGYKWQDARKEDDWNMHNLNEIEDIRCLQLYNKLKEKRL